ncbi:MAG: radical SAM protein [Rhodobacterales bacterium]|nr:radical SAM protein [Rhodobacterales bacterium]
METIHPITLGDLALAPPVALAPLAGITDLPFRQLVASFGAGWVVSEMVASQEMVQAKPGIREKAELGLGQANTAIQLAGREARWMAEAARMVEANGARMIDINMGCPAKKVTNGYSGSALLRDPDHALRLIEAVVGAVSVPVTLKTRLGWDDACLNAASVARRAENAGVRLVTIHGRTRCQFYKGRADWTAIRAVRGMGYLVGLHTAGLFPTRLAEVLPLVDWVGLDIKAPFDGRYDRITGREHSFEAPAESLRLLLASGVPYELRTTVHPDLLAPEDLEDIADGLRARGAKPTVIQAFRPHGCLDRGLLA